MSGSTSAVERLITSLDALGHRPSVGQIRDAVLHADLKLVDVAPWVRTDPRRYNRNRVVLRDDYELLVMSWLPGQASVPHDHAGSICVLQVLDGSGVERTYRPTDDGFVEEWLASDLSTGQLVAGDDAGIHSVHNDAADGRTLVTVHVYSPPLKDFRRFVTRPAANAAPVPVRVRDRLRSVCVIGGDFSGAMAAANLLKQAHRLGQGLAVTLVERRGTVGEGVAYGTQEDVHKLNVAAARMSAWPDQPDDFLNWARARDATVGPRDFLPRRLFAQYVREQLEATARIAADNTELHIVLDEARRVCHHPQGGWMVHLGRTPSVHADAVVLAVGHRPPSDPLADVWSGPRHRWIGDPWRPFAVADIRPDEPVVILGSGLTAVDTLLSLTSEGSPRRTAPIWMVSRRAMLPHAHLDVPNPPANLQMLIDGLVKGGPLTTRQLVRGVRREIHAITRTAPDADWRTIVDGLRPHTVAIWAALSSSQRRRFVTYVRPIWEVHRHRMAPDVARTIHRLENEGSFTRVSGRVIRAVAIDDRVLVSVRSRAESKIAGDRALEAAWVVNCTGPTPSNLAESNPLVASLLELGALRVDPLGIGLETEASGRALGVDQVPRHDLYVVGTLRKPANWESTAVPELRQQAAATAEAVLDQINAPNCVTVARVTQDANR